MAVSSRARALRVAGRRVIDLGAGEPDFATPEHVRRAAQRAIDEGATRYTAVEGILPLREAIAAQAAALYQGADRPSPAEVVVTAGAKQALFNACFALFGEGDDVLVPTPAWTSYYEILSLARANAIPVFGRGEHGLKATAAELAAAATPLTRGVIVNSPNNPTRAVYSAGELDAIVALAAERGWWLISDEIYRAISYERTAPSVLDVARSRDGIIVVDGVAKAFAMTGWRIGWAIAPRGVVAAMSALQSHTTSNAATVSQHAALAALTAGDVGRQAVDAMVAQFRGRRDAALPILRQAGLEVVEPQGAFYLYVRVGSVTPATPDPGTAFAERLLEEHGVAVVPGVAFRTPEWIRVSYAAAESDVLEGARCIVSLAAGNA